MVVDCVVPATPVASTSADIHNRYISPAASLPLIKAGPKKHRNNNRGKKRGSTKILTYTPVKNDRQQAHEAKMARLNRAATTKNTILFQGSKKIQKKMHSRR